MNSLAVKQREVEDRLLEKVTTTTPSKKAVWHLRGATGMGKSAVLFELLRRLKSQECVPVIVSAPAGEIDAAPIALAELASGMHRAGLINGQIDMMRDPRVPTFDKVVAAKDWVEKHQASVVLLCDEPGQWGGHDPAGDWDTSERVARELAEWVVVTAPCRRVIAGRFPEHTLVPSEALPRIDQPESFIRNAITSAMLLTTADHLARRGATRLTGISPLMAKLLVALAEVTSPEQVLNEFTPYESEREVVARLFASLEAAPRWSGLCKAIACIALARGPIPVPVMRAVSRTADPLYLALIEECLSLGKLEHRELHSSIRQSVLHQITNRSVDPWRLEADDVAHVRGCLIDYYEAETARGEELRRGIELYYHSRLPGGRPPHAGQGPYFSEQIHAVGRTLSFVYRDHQAAAAVFQYAIDLDPNDDYAHHYLAFNLDWEAVDAERVERHYRRAIDVNPGHPWWWSRWISYLITRGRSGEAKACWRTALDALSVTDADGPDVIYTSLHKWVARWLLHWGNVEFAASVLNAVPAAVRSIDVGFQAMERLLMALREAERGTAVFPLSISPEEWWSTQPHLPFQKEWKGQRLMKWRPARVQGVDKNEVELLVGAPPAHDTASPEVAVFTFTRDEFEAAADGFQWSELSEGSYIELAFYGADGSMRAMMHRNLAWHDPDLPPLVPPPNRWIRKIVNKI